MGIKFKNNAFGVLDSPITNVAPTIQLSAGHGARFPALGAGDYFYATLLDAAAHIEIVKVTARVVDTLTVVRGQDGTAGRAWIAGDRLEARPCNAALLALAQESEVFTAATGAGAYAATLDPVPTGYNTNQVYHVTFVTANTIDSPTLNVNALGPKVMKRIGGGMIKTGEIPPGMHAYLLFDGVDLILLNQLAAVGAGSVVTATGTDAYVGTLPYPVPVAWQTDRLYQVTFTNANTITAPTLDLSGMGPKTIKAVGGIALTPGQMVAGVTALLQYNGVDLIHLLLSPASAIPPGAMMDYGGGTVAAGWLLCDGAAVPRAGYPLLFAAIGVLWGAGDGSTTFNVPNFQRRVAVGSGGALSTTLGNVVGNVGGEEAHAQLLAEMAAHNHPATVGSHVHGLNLYGWHADGNSPTNADGGLVGRGANQFTTAAASPTMTIDPVGGGAPANVMQPSAVVTKIIKI